MIILLLQPFIYGIESTFHFFASDAYVVTIFIA